MNFNSIQKSHNIEKNSIHSVVCSQDQTILHFNQSKSIFIAGLDFNDHIHSTFEEFKIELLSKPCEIKQIEAGKSHLLILTNDGKVYGCGNNDHGQLGLGSQNYFEKFVELVNNKYCVF